MLDESELETISAKVKQTPAVPARIQRNLDRLKPQELPPPIDELPSDLGPPKATAEPSFVDLVGGAP